MAQTPDAAAAAEARPGGTEGGDADGEGAAARGDPRPRMILDHWLDEVGPAGWYEADEARDAAIRERFGAMWDHAVEGALSLWLTHPTGALAYIVLTDQMPRNMWRGHARAFASDHMALAAAKAAVDRDWDRAVEEPARQFFYLPLMHSERLPDQERCMRLMLTRLRETGASNLRHAKAHREVIRRFGRFPTRNAALGRVDTAAEAAFLEAGGYGAVLREIEAKEG